MKINTKLKSTLEKILLKAPKNLRWGFYSGIASFFYGSDREPTDIDIIVHESDMQGFTKALKEYLVLSPQWIKTDIFKVHLARFKLNEYEIEVSSGVLIMIGKNRYLLTVDKKMIEKIRLLNVDNLRIPVVAPEDIIVFKAIAQRGKERNKFDIPDIKAILENQKIDWDYLEERSRITKSCDRVFGLLESLGYQKGR